VGLARAFAAVLGESHPCNDLAVLLVSELVTNSVRHSGSAVAGWWPWPWLSAREVSGWR
jgi:hypothetical protein